MANWDIKIRDDGVMTFGGYVVVAADIDNPKTGHKGRFERGDIVETSLGPGIVIDYCGQATVEKDDFFDVSVKGWKND